MINKLDVLVNLIQKETGLDITKKDRRREVTYARAVYCKIAKELIDDGNSYSLSRVGRAINKDHATVIHNVKNIFPFAIKQKKYKILYNCLQVLINEDFNEQSLQDRKLTIENLLRGIEERDEKIQELKRENIRYNVVIDGLTMDERNELFKKIELTAKVLKAQRGAYV